MRLLSELPYNEARPIWVEFSRRYAEQARGRVKVYLEEGMKPGTIFAQTELGKLLTNSKVTQIDGFVMDKGQWVQKEWFKPKAG